MLRDKIQFVGMWLKRVVTQPRSELTRWQRAARFAYDLGRDGATQLRRDRAPQMAGALAFRTLFGLIPVAVVGTILVRAFRGTDQFFDVFRRVLTAVGLDDVRVFTEGASNGESASITLSQWLVDQVNRAQDINLTAIGWLGVAILIYSAVSLMVTIENSFNVIFRAPSGRSWGRRLMMYWSVLSLGPLAIGMMTFFNTQFSGWLATLNDWPWWLAIAPVVWNFIVTWLLMLSIYKLVPNTTVSLRPALVGAFVTAVLVEAGRRGLGAYLQNLLSLRQLYGSLGLVPLFMFWVYIMWLVVLFGLEVSATLQMLGGRRLDEIERPARPTGLVDPASVVLVMELVIERFGSGQPVTARGIVDATGMPEPTVAQMLEHLVERRFLHRLETGENAFVLARPPDLIAADDLVTIGFELVQSGSGGRRSELVQRLHQAQRAVAAQITLGPPKPSTDAESRPG